MDPWCSVFRSPLSNFLIPIFLSDVDDDEVELTKDERERLINFPAKTDIKFEKELTQSVYFGLVDILFAYLYDLRTTDGEHNSESGW